MNMTQYTKQKLGDICRIEKGRTGIASAAPGEYPLVVTAEERKTCSTYQFDCEAVCIPLVSSSGHGKKSLKNVHYQSGKFALGSILCAVIPNNPQQVNARYLRQYLQFYKDTLLVPLMKGAANVSLSMRDIANVEVPLPDFKAQTELAELFAAMQAKQKELNAEFEKQTEYAKLLRQNILQEAIEGKLTAGWRKQNPVVKGNPDFDAEALFEQIQKEKEGNAFPCGRTPSRPTPSADLEVVAGATIKRARNARLENDQPFEIPDGWKWVKIEQITIFVGNKRNQILTKELKDSGKYPAVSQGQNLIDGYSDDEDKVITDIPLIMFGDHTRNVKFIDFPFVINADGTKFFKSILCSPKYLYYIILFLSKKIRNRGYARHYSLLKKEKFPLPPLAEQKEIVAKIESLLANVTELENQIQERKKLSGKLMQVVSKNAFAPQK